MIFIAIDDNGKATGYGTDPALFDGGPTLLSRWDYTGFDHVQRLAQELTEETGKLFLGVDSGESVSPRYDVVEAPKVGEAVSYAFNGDYYPCGTIESISASLRVIVTTTGHKFYRKRQSGRWVYSKTWSLVKGHHNDKNPSF